MGNPIALTVKLEKNKDPANKNAQILFNKYQDVSTPPTLCDITHHIPTLKGHMKQ